MSYFTDEMDAANLLQERLISLNPSDFIVANQTSLHLANTTTAQWDLYLRLLGLYGFQQWVEQHSSSRSIALDHCSALQSSYATTLEAVCNVQIGELKICLLILDYPSDVLSLPRATIELGEFAAHLYLVLEVQEEAGQVIYHGCLRHDQIKLYQANYGLEPESNWNYLIPLQWFYSSNDRPPDLAQLWVYLTHLKRERVPLPAPVNVEAELSRLRGALEQQMSQLQHCGTELWQVLSWEQGRLVLTQPALLDWIETLQQETDDAIEWHTTRLHETVMRLTKQSINVAHWLCDEVDAAARSLAFILLPAFSPQTVGLRSPTEELDKIIASLKQSGVHIPETARGSYRNLKLNQFPLRLYTVIWSGFSPQNEPEWSLVLLLAPLPGTLLPDELSLKVSDQYGEEIDTQVFRRSSGETYLRSRVVGHWEEKFVVDISLNDEVLPLCPFAFVPANFDD